MKFLVAIPKERVTDGKWTTRREPVVPCFPSQHGAAFLAVPSFLLADRAEVAETDADPDALVDALEKEYPGLPRKLHENYVMAVFKAAFEAPTGTIYKISVSQRQALLIDPKTGTTTSLWDSQPLT